MSGLRMTMIRRGEALVPAAQMYLDDLQKIPDGDHVVVTWKRIRSVQHHRRFFAKLRKLWQATGWDGDESSLLNYLKIGIGYVLAVIDNSSTMVSGSMLSIAEGMVAKYGQASDEGRLARFVISIAGPKTYLVPKSINFETLDQTEFGDFEKRTDEFTARAFGIDPEELMRQATELGALATSDEPAAPVPQDNAPSQLEARLRALAEHLHFDAPEDFEAALTQARAAGRLRELERDAPKQTKAVIELCRKAAGGMFDNAGFEEVLAKILADATSHAEKRRAA